VGEAPAVVQDEMFAYDEYRLPYISLTNYSGVSISVPSRKLLPAGCADCRQLAVDREIILKPDDFLAGIDPVLDWIMTQ
jgi:hypothetical protein